MVESEQEQYEVVVEVWMDDIKSGVGSFRTGVDALDAIDAWTEMGARLRFIKGEAAVAEARGEKLPFLATTAEVRAFQQEYGIRDDWHEPDEQGLTYEVVPGRFGFDNAMCDAKEDHIVLSIEGVPQAAINVAMLLAMAGGAA